MGQTQNRRPSMKFVRGNSANSDGKQVASHGGNRHALPAPIVSSRGGATCHCCETEWVLVWTHSHYPDMKVCEECLTSYGGMGYDSLHYRTNMAKDFESWDHMAAYLGHDVVKR